MKTDQTTRQQEAADNNADLYKHMFEAHGVSFEWSSGLFYTSEQPLPFYSSIVTLEPAVSLQTINELTANASFPVFIKDSFADLSLETLGFSSLFEACWFYLEAPVQADTSGWQQISTPKQLQSWEASWKNAGNQTDRAMFPPKLLDNPDFAFWGYFEGSEITKGFIGNHSGTSVGLSNFFAEDLSPHTFRQMAALLQRWKPEKPVTGYARGDALLNARTAGFETSGKLKVWHKPYSGC
ncbi:hypothetical protein PSE_3170 [Pseudovibrio sp. FO-BEG1]|uniref:hypothetical protein n=1 Tax=Pseudovibrio sp. (strain FO-BEG1) TaxID=911045 RepID=UPI000238BF7D|nr:hypothetical protein [Pseudovibrio sp. FO-BEG1]AEV37678.1 hypothetical protein PSE_3170 [Pseudovibrio sp. FO-BEG1]